MIDSYNQWWSACCEQAERTTARQIGVPNGLCGEHVPIDKVRAAVAKMMAPKAQDLQPVHRSASLRTRMMLVAANQRRAELGQPLISFD